MTADELKIAEKLNTHVLAITTPMIGAPLKLLYEMKDKGWLNQMLPDPKYGRHSLWSLTTAGIAALPINSFL